MLHHSLWELMTFFIQIQSQLSSLSQQRHGRISLQGARSIASGLIYKGSSRNIFQRNELEKSRFIPLRKDTCIQMLFCGQCGLQLAPGSTACPRCGTVTQPTLPPLDNPHSEDPTMQSDPRLPLQQPQTPIDNPSE